MMTALSFIVGLMVGSFLNVLILRLPKGASIYFPASHCPVCKTPLKPWHNIPLLSWLFLEGKCAFCHIKISMQYPLIEAVTGLLFVTAVSEFGWTVQALFVGLSFAMLLALAVIDWRYKAVPDSLNLLALLFALAAFPYLEAFADALLFAGGFALLRLVMSYYVFKKLSFLEKKSRPAMWRTHYDTVPASEAMGEADIMIAATIGALLGIELGMAAIFLASVLALPVALLRAKKERQTPFIPFLALGVWLVFYFYETVDTVLKSLYA